MDTLSTEILQQILSHIDNLSELLRTSSVCRKWRSCTLKDEWFMNEFFIRRYQKSISIGTNWTSNSPDLSSDDNSVNGVSSIHLPSPISAVVHTSTLYVAGSSSYLAQPINGLLSQVFKKSFTIAFDIFLPNDAEIFELDFGYRNGKLYLWPFHEDFMIEYRRNCSGVFKKFPLKNRWTRWILMKKKEDYKYRLYVNGRELELFTYIDYNYDFIETKLTLLYFTGQLSAAGAYLADFQVFPLCLNSYEIEAINEQQVSFKKVKTGSYLLRHWLMMKNKKYIRRKLIFIFTIILLGFCALFLLSLLG